MQWILFSSNFFFHNFFLPAVLYNILVQKIYAQKYFTWVSNQNLTDIYIYFWHWMVPTESNKIFHFFILKKKHKPKQLKHQLISWQVKFKKLGIYNRFTSLCFQNASTNDWSIAVARSMLFHRTDTCVACFCCACAGACAVSRIA